MTLRLTCTPEFWVLVMELASCQPSGAKNLEMVKFLENLYTLIYLFVRSEILTVRAMKIISSIYF